MKINELELLDVSGGFESDLFDYGSMRDTIGHFDYIFTPGVYVVKGECGLGGWALTEILTGRDSNFTGSIRVNGNEIDSAQLRNYACYVGDDLNIDKKRYWGKRTIRKQITNAIDNKLGFGKGVEEIKDMFELSDGRFERSLCQTSGERWRISMAVGYAYEKKIYCFPWVNSRFLKSLLCLQLCFKHLLESGAIIIIPTTYPEVLDEIVENYTVINFQVN